MKKNEQLYTRVELAARLGVSPGTIYNWTRSGQIRCYRTGPRLVRYKWEEVANDLNLES